MMPLRDIAVVECASYISGPFAAMILADLGATVVKVEPPRGDPYRRFGNMEGDASAFFRATNQNKNNVQLDLKSSEGMDALWTLLESADVFVSNWRPHVAGELGLTEQAVRERCPALIWVRVSGYGPTGPSADLPAYDSIVQARSGIMRPTGGEVHDPKSLIADKVSAMSAAQTAMAALIARGNADDPDTAGQICDVPMIDAMAYFLSPDLAAGHRSPGEDPDPSCVEQLHANRPFPTADSWLMLSPVSGKQVRSSLRAAGVEDKWDWVIGGVATGDTFARFSEAMGPALLERSTAEWEQAFRDADVPASAVLTLSEHLDDAQIAHNSTWEVIDAPQVGAYRRARFPAFFSGEKSETLGLPSPSLETDGS